jgi:hypothetical protein
MGTDKDVVRCHLSEHGIENRPVASAFDGIDPDQDRVNRHELPANFGAKIVVINGRFGMYRSGRKSLKQTCETA